MVDESRMRRLCRGLVPVALVWGLQAVVYLLPRLLVTGWYVPGLAAWDADIPYVPAFVVFYIGAFVQWIVYYWHLAVEDTALSWRLFASHAFALLVCAVCFFALPFTIERPAIEGGGIIAWLLGIVYAVDPPTRLFPSLHCLVSYLCTRRTLALKTTKPLVKAGSVAFTVLVCLSTVLIRQHYAVDVVAGVALAEISFQVVHATGFTDAFRRLSVRIQDGLFGKAE